MKKKPMTSSEMAQKKAKLMTKAERKAHSIMMLKNRKWRPIKQGK